MTLLERLLQERNNIQAQLEGGLAAIAYRAADAANDVSLTPEARAAARDMSAEERAAFDHLAADAEALDERIAQLRRVADRSDAAAAGQRAAHVRSEPLTYNPGNAHEISYFRDLSHLAVAGRDGAVEALGRLQHHATEMRVEMPARAQRRAEAAERELRSIDPASMFESRAGSTSDGAGGYFVPPLWLIDEWIGLLRSGRIVANRLRQMPLPKGTNSVNIPKLSQGTVVAPQTVENSPVASQDIDDTAVSAPVKTVAGQTDVSIQLLDQSPGQIIDQVIMGDLMAAYDQEIDSLALTYLIANAGIAVSYTSGSPAVQELWTPLAQALSKIATVRKVITGVEAFMHPRRWFWMSAALDSSNRPLILPSNAYNPLAIAGSMAAEGQVGTLMLGPGVYADGNVTTADTTGGGSGQDVIPVVKTDDVLLFEGEPTLRSLQEVLSGTLGVRFQIYNYWAILARYAEAMAVIAGSGLAAPAGF